ncbi:replication protein a-related [Anaeramoeba flamelloides]|uniref:Replication protein a-related n=1 Tax=Anaeramoeba flamelloides TaxID=1746091 RepID=A0ABQ8YAK5_9EUKA|nr:replication protein a-related [Anaeramoeba flamelloides]
MTNNSNENVIVRTITPLTIRQIQLSTESEGNTFKIDNEFVMNVSLVGTVIKVLDGNTYTNYTIDDGTGQLKIREFKRQKQNNMEEEEEQQQQQQQQEEGGEGENKSKAKEIENAFENKYVRIIGNLKEYKNQKSFSVSKITEITDSNQITTHFLEAILVHLQRIKGTLKKEQTSSQNSQIKEEKNEIKKETNNNNNNNNNNNIITQQNTNQILGLALKDKALRLISSNQTSSGISLQELAKELKSTEEEIREIVDFFLDQGQIYITIDDEHFRSTD